MPYGSCELGGRHGRVDLHLRGEQLLGEPLARISEKCLPECGKRLPCHGEPRGHRVPPALYEAVLAGPQRLREVEPRDAAARAVPLLPVERDEQHRLIKPFHEPGGDNADHAAVPPVCPEDNGGALGKLRAARERLRKDAPLLRLTLGVRRRELPRELLGARGVLGQQQLHPGGGVRHPARRVDPRGEGEADGAGPDLLARKAALLDQSGKAHTAAPPDLRKAARDDRPVLPHERHHVRNGAERREVEVGLRLRAQRLRELERDPDARELLEGIGAVRPVGVDHRVALGQRLRALVVVGHDERERELARRLRLLGGGDPGVHRDHKRAALLRCPP